MRAPLAGNSIIAVGIIALIGSLAKVSLELRRADSPLLQSTFSEVRSDGTDRLLWLFQPEDCGQSQEVLDVLNEAYRSGKRVSGIIGSRNQTTVENAKIAFGIGIPLVEADPSQIGRFLLMLGYHASPVLVALDKDGQVQQVVPAESAVAFARRWLTNNQPR